MKLHTLLLVPACVLAPAFVAAGDALTFHAAAKTKLTKTFTSKLAMDCEEFSMSVDGEEMPLGDHAPKIHVEDAETYKVTDVYLAVDGERATKLERTYDDLGTESLQRVTPPAVAGGEDQEKKSTKTCALEGKTVVFTWKDDDYSAGWREGEKGDDDLLADLAGDLDFTELLPGKSVAEGASWDVDGKAFARAFQPLGVLVMKTEGDDDADDAESIEVEKQLAKNRTGKGKATYKGTRDEGGVKVAVIEFAAELSGSASVERGDTPTELSVAADVTGQLLWDVEHGHFHALELSGKSKMKMNVKRSLEQGGESHQLVQSFEFAGDVELKVEVE